MCVDRTNGSGQGRQRWCRRPGQGGGVWPAAGSVTGAVLASYVTLFHCLFRHPLAEFMWHDGASPLPHVLHVYLSPSVRHHLQLASACCHHQSRHLLWHSPVPASVPEPAPKVRAARAWMPSTGEPVPRRCQQTRGLGQVPLHPAAAAPPGTPHRRPGSPLKRTPPSAVALRAGLGCAEGIFALG